MTIQTSNQLNEAANLLDQVYRDNNLDACKTLEKKMWHTLQKEEQQQIFISANTLALQNQTPALLLYFIAWCTRYGKGTELDRSQALHRTKQALSRFPEDSTLKIFFEDKFTEFTAAHQTIAENFAKGEFKHLAQLQAIIINNTQAEILFNICLNAATKNPQVNYFIAWCYLNGYGIAANKELAKQFAKEALQQHFADAAVILADCEAQDMSLYQFAANNGSLLGQYNLLLLKLRSPSDFLSFWSNNLSRIYTAHVLKQLASKGCPDAAAVAASQFNLQHQFINTIRCLRLAIYFDSYQRIKEEIRDRLKFLYAHAPQNIIDKHCYDLGIVQYDYFNNDNTISQVIQQTKNKNIVLTAMQKDPYLTEKTSAKIINLLFLAKFKFDISHFFNIYFDRSWLKSLARLAEIDFATFISLLYQKKIAIDKTETILRNINSSEIGLDNITANKFNEQIQQISTRSVIPTLSQHYQRLQKTKETNQETIDIESIVSTVISAIEQLNKIPPETPFDLHQQLRNEITGKTIALLKFAIEYSKKDQEISDAIEITLQNLQMNNPTQHAMYYRFFQQHTILPKLLANTTNPTRHDLNAPRAVHT